MALCTGLTAAGTFGSVSRMPRRAPARTEAALPLAARFVSLRAPRANLRVGPGTDVMRSSGRSSRSGVPLEIVQEYDNWRRVRDAEGGRRGWNQPLAAVGQPDRHSCAVEKGQIPELPLRAQPEEENRPRRGAARARPDGRTALLRRAVV